MDEGRQGKDTYYTRLKSKNPMGFAGLYNNWKSPECEKIFTSTIITTDANELMTQIHNRMPVILHQVDILSGLTDGDSRIRLSCY